MSHPNETQVGGTHYKSEYQHWDMAIRYGLRHLAAASTKYLTRWRQKGGIADLQKALHYLQKALHAEGYQYSLFERTPVSLNDYFEANEIYSPLDREAISCIVAWDNDHTGNVQALRTAIAAVGKQIELVENGQVQLPKPWKPYWGCPHCGTLVLADNASAAAAQHGDCATPRGYVDQD